VAGQQGQGGLGLVHLSGDHGVLDHDGAQKLVPAANVSWETRSSMRSRSVASRMPLKFGSNPTVSTSLRWVRTLWRVVTR
jgi:hypothetical protein